jgi:hypothetical protein
MLIGTILNNPNVANRIILIYPSKNTREKNQQEQLPLFHLWTFTSNVTQDFMAKDSNMPAALSYLVYISNSHVLR